MTVTSGLSRRLPPATAIATIYILLGFGTARAMADTWCYANFPNAIVCEDFDRYCDPPPPYPQACAVGSTKDLASFYDRWVASGDLSGPCASSLGLDADFISSSPWAGMTNTQEKGDFGYSVRTLVNDIRQTFGPAYTSVIGTDLNPLVLEFVLNGQRFGRAPFNNSFFTLASGFSFAPTDWAYADWCGCMDPPLKRWPVICQQETPVAACPPIASAPTVSAIAVGFLAYLDNNPCHCGASGPQSPYNDHLSFFDGHKWYRLRQGLFPGSGDFLVRNYENRIRITIKTTSMKVELTCPDTGEYSWCTIGGAYAGPFDSFGVGFHKACRLSSSQWSCSDEASCDVTVGLPGGGVPHYDNIALHGGACYTAPGACCKPDTTCVETPGPCECQSQGGQFAGPATACATTACCPPQPADHDLDGDVDIGDFGWFQRCLSGADHPSASVPCQCSDLDHDEDVDAADFTRFLNCMLGPDIPANPSCAG